MKNLERRLSRLEQCMTDMQDPEHRLPKALFSIQAVRAVMQLTDNPASLAGSLCED
jgi:hypothetical protein